jgi:hypothetical protein
MLLEGLWFTGLGVGQSSIAAFPAPPSFSGPAAPTFGSPLCFFANGRDVPAGFGAGGFPALLQDFDPAYSSGIGGSIALPRSSRDIPCGFRGAIGLASQNWALSKSGLLPESLRTDPWIDGPCSNGLDDDGDGYTDYPDDPGCSAVDDSSEQSAAECDNGIDDDGDGLIDYAADPGCSQPQANRERTECQDGIDNDGQLGTDFDGGASVNAGVPLDVPDPQCSAPWRKTEGHTCGLGAELVAPLALTFAINRMRSQRKRKRNLSGT